MNLEFENKKITIISISLIIVLTCLLVFIGYKIKKDIFDQKKPENVSKEEIQKDIVNDEMEIRNNQELIDSLTVKKEVEPEKIDIPVSSPTETVKTEEEVEITSNKNVMESFVVPNKATSNSKDDDNDEESDLRKDSDLMKSFSVPN